MDANAKLEMVEKALAEGRTVYFCTALRITKITPKNAAAWAAEGSPLVRVRNNELQIREGRRMVNADYCSIRVG